MQPPTGVAFDFLEKGTLKWSDKVVTLKGVQWIAQLNQYLLMS